MADYDEYRAVHHLLQHLPGNLLGLWLEVDQLHNILLRGGFPLLPKIVVVKYLRGNRDAIPQRNTFSHKTYYQYGDTTNKPKCFKEQRDSGISIPEFVDGFYTQDGGNFFPDQVDFLKRKGYCQETVSTASDLVTASGASVLVTTVTATATANSNPTESSSENDKENMRPPAGLKIVDMDVNDDFIQEIQAHANKCHCPMTRVSQTKMGFDLKEHWKCSFCHWTIHRRLGKDANPLMPKRGPKPSELNITVTTAFLSPESGSTKQMKSVQMLESSVQQLLTIANKLRKYRQLLGRYLRNSSRRIVGNMSLLVAHCLIIWEI
jgi:hypothetical protein